MIQILHILSPKWFAFMSWVIILITPTMLGAKILGFYWLYLGIALGLISIGLIIKHFIVFVPKKSALLIMNSLLNNKSNGEAQIRTVPSGLSIKYPWEQAEEDGLFSLENMRISFSETYPAKDGPAIQIEGSFVFSPDPENLLQYFVSKKIVSGKILDKIRGFNSAVVSKQNAVTARNKIKDISDKITKYFSGNFNNTDEEKDGTKTVTELEETYGIEFKELTIADVNYEKSFQKALTTKAAANVLRKAVDDTRKPKKERDEKTLTEGEAWDNILVVHGSVEKNIQKVEGEGGEALAALLMGMANAKGTKNNQRAAIKEK